jgi:hypothetical protein
MNNFGTGIRPQRDIEKKDEAGELKLEAKRRVRTPR